MQDVHCQVYGIVVFVLAYIDHVCKLCRSAVEKDQAMVLKTDPALHDRGHCDRAVAIYFLGFRYRPLVFSLASMSGKVPGIWLIGAPSV